jgi:hypothetical protein
MKMETKKTDGEIFKYAMDGVPKRDFKLVWRTIMNDCSVEYYTVINWRNGRCCIPDEAKAKIERILGAEIFNTKVPKNQESQNIA